MRRMFRSLPRMRRSLGMALVLAVFASAVPVALAKDPPVSQYKLQLRKVDGIPTGKAALVMGKVGDKAHRFYLDNLNMLVPVVVTLRPGTPGADANLRITKYGWNDPVREGRTKGTEQVSFRFRTQGEFQIAVTGAKPDTPYKLLVWAGDEVKPDFKPVVVTRSEYEKTQDSSWLPGGAVLWVIAAALLGILGLLAVLVLRRKRA